MFKLAALGILTGLLCASLPGTPGYAQKAAGAGNAGPNAIAPDFSGVWTHGAHQGGGRIGAVRNLSTRGGVVGDYKNPILQPWAAAIVKHNGDLENAGFAAPETKLTCWPGGVPNMLSIPSSMELLQTPEQVTMLFENDHQVRFIYLNRQHSAHVTPSWFGESVGHYEGDTLVVDTTGLAAKPMSQVDVFGTPHTDALHVVERFHMVDGGKTLRIDMTIEDPGAFTAPWSETAIFAKLNSDFTEYVCAENNPQIGIDAKAGEMPRAKYVAPF